MSQLSAIDAMPHDVFISYANQDKILADALCNTLEKSGLRCWIAPRDVSLGNWAASIVDSIAASRAFVLVFSSRSNASERVKDEIVHAASTGAIIIPVRVENVVMSKDIELFLKRHHWIDAMTPPIEKQFQDVALKLGQWLEIEPLRRDEKTINLSQRYDVLRPTLITCSVFAVVVACICLIVPSLRQRIAIPPVVSTQPQSNTVVSVANSKSMPQPSAAVEFTLVFGRFNDEQKAKGFVRMLNDNGVESKVVRNHKDQQSVLLAVSQVVGPYPQIEALKSLLSARYSINSTIQPSTQP